MKVTNFVNVAGYEAGVNGNRLVSMDPNLSCCPTKRKLFLLGEKEYSVPLMIGTVKLLDDEFIDELEERVDENTSCDEVIVVREEFFKLSKKCQLVLLMIQNRKFDFPDDSGLKELANIQACIAARQLYGNHVVDKALIKALKLQQKGERKVATANRKNAKQPVLFKKKKVTTPTPKITTDEKTNDMEPELEPSV